MDIANKNLFIYLIYLTLPEILNRAANTKYKNIHKSGNRVNLLVNFLGARGLGRH